LLGREKQDNIHVVWHSIVSCVLFMFNHTKYLISNCHAKVHLYEELNNELKTKKLKDYENQ